MTKYSADALQKHARELAVAFNVRLIESDQLKPEEAIALAHMRVILTSPVVEETTYAVVLHEMGHVVSPMGAIRQHVTGGDRLNLMLEEEEAAWAWAKHYAIEWTAVMQGVADWAYGTYTAATMPPTRPSPNMAPAPPTEPVPAQPSKPTIVWKDWK